MRYDTLKIKSRTLNSQLIYVNQKREYHNCSMIFSYYQTHTPSHFQVDCTLRYHIFTTLTELKLLNEALHIYQAHGFKEAYLKYNSEIHAKDENSEFAKKLQEAQQIAKELQSLAQDEDSLVQLQEYILETPPTYVDDFYINKKIEAIIIDEATHTISDYKAIKKLLASY